MENTVETANMVANNTTAAAEQGRFRRRDHNLAVGGSLQAPRNNSGAYRLPERKKYRPL